MKKTNKFTLRTRVTMGFTLIVVFLIFIIMRAYFDITEIQASQSRLYDYHFSNSNLLKDVRVNQLTTRASLLSMMLTQDTTEWVSFEQDVHSIQKDSASKIRVLLDKNKNNPAIFRKLEEFQRIYQGFAETRENQIVSLIKQGQLDRANELTIGIQQDRSKKMTVIAEDLIAQADSDAQQAVENAQILATQSRQISLTIGAIIIMISLIMSWLLNRLIASLSAEIREGTNVLASASSEIVATTTQVASGATETASAITETTTTVDEIKKTAELSSEKARYVSETAQKTSEISKNGQQAVDQSIEGVNQVHQQMMNLSESIVQLSEQSQAIGEIIATVNDLAEQSNLLAVNAAIEASKAGEQGKGFSVVAQEIKSLAEQSKQATGQVRIILGDIQKATSASVLAAEQGSKAVDVGVKQTALAGETINALAQSIADVAQAAMQIAASSQQQQVGMDQIAIAIDNIRQASAQNVTGTKQAELAAHDLSDLGQKLKGIIEEYKI